MWYTVRLFCEGQNKWNLASYLPGSKLPQRIPASLLLHKREDTPWHPCTQEDLLTGVCTLPKLTGLQLSKLLYKGWGSPDLHALYPAENSYGK